MMKELSRWLESANKVLDIWFAFTWEKRIKTKDELDNIVLLYGWDFPADIERLKSEVRLLSNNARLLDIVSELSESVGKPSEPVLTKMLADLYNTAEKLEFVYNGERRPNEATPDTKKRAYFFGYGDNDEEVNRLNLLLLDMFTELDIAMLNLHNRLCMMFSEKECEENIAIQQEENKYSAELLNLFHNHADLLDELIGLSDIEKARKINKWVKQRDKQGKALIENPKDNNKSKFARLLKEAGLINLSERTFRDYL